MKIENSIKTVGSAPSPELRPRPAPTASAPAGDKVELSALAASLQKAESAMKATPVIDRARVDEIRQAISEGRFRINADKIADGLLNSVKELLAGRSDH